MKGDRPWPRRAEPREVIQIALGDAAVERLRDAAARRGVDLEHLIVEVLNIASYYTEGLPNGSLQSVPDEDA